MINDEDMHTRKRRRIMKEADGFIKEGAPKASKVQVPLFTPAFEGQQVRKSAATPSAKPTSVPKTEKIIVRPGYDTSSFASEHTAQKTSVSSSNLIPVSKGVPPKKVSLSKPISKANLKQLEPPKAPVFTTEQHLSGSRPRKPPISHAQDNTIASSSWKRLPSPPAVPALETTSRSHHTLQSLCPPPVPSKSSTTPKPMRTIFTTHIACTNDLSTDIGKAELASMFLHDQHPEISAEAENSEDVNLINLGVSPQKMGRTFKGKGKQPKFIRNGLAARASMLFSQTHTALALWQKEIENTVSSSGSTSRRLTPDIRLHIVKILDLPVGSGSRRPGTSMTSPGLAVCRLKHTSHSVLGKAEDKTFLVVLSFPTTASPRTNMLHARNPEDFIEGREVYVWEPWQEVSLSSSLPAASASFSELSHVTAAPFPPLPPSFTLSPRIKEEDSSDTALLCSRFLIMR